MYLPDGDLHGEGRKRNFRWRGIDSNSQMDLFDNKLWSEEDHGNIELLTEEECKRRKERFERDTFLREEMVGPCCTVTFIMRNFFHHNHQRRPVLSINKALASYFQSKTNQDAFIDMDENSQVIMNFIKDTSNASPGTTS